MTDDDVVLLDLFDGDRPAWAHVSQPRRRWPSTGRQTPTCSAPRDGDFRSAASRSTTATVTRRPSAVEDDAQGVDRGVVEWRPPAG